MCVACEECWCKTSHEDLLELSEVPAVSYFIPVRVNKIVKFFARWVHDVNKAQWYITYLLFKCTAIDSGCGLIFSISFFFSFLFFCFWDTKLASLYLYHFASYMRIYTPYNRPSTTSEFRIQPQQSLFVPKNYNGIT